MIKNKLKNIFTFVLILISTSVSAGHEFDKALALGKSVVLIINADESAKSEQYADWSHYLNEFSSEVGNSYVFHKVSTADLNKIIMNGGKFKENYSMIFMKKGKASYFYQGPILEPQVYKFMRLTYLGKPIKPKYLNQFSPKEIKLEFKKCE